MRPALILMPIAVLAACATPREQCINTATQNTRVLSALITETEGNLARGYALEQSQEVRVVRGTCQGENADGSSFFFGCDQTETYNTTTPVAIDLNAEQAKLNSLRQRFAQEQSASNQAVAQCIAIHPE